MSINSITISGNLTEDPKRPSGQNGPMGMVTCNLAHNIRDSRNGDSVIYFKLIRWDNRDGKNPLESYCRKGSKLVVNGSLKIYENVSQKNGNKYQNNEIAVSSFEILTPRDANGNGGDVNGYDTSSNNRNSNNQSGQNGQGGHIEDDVPF